MNQTPQPPQNPTPTRRSRPTKKQFMIRRILVLLIFAGIIFGIFKGVTMATGFVSGAFNPDSAASPSSTETSDVPSQTKSPTNSNIGACDDADIDVTVKVQGSDTFSDDESVTLSATISNSGMSACLRDVGARSNEVFVTDTSGEMIWSSNDCPVNKKINLVEMQPQDVYQVVLSWGGFKSPAVCGEPSDRVPKGIYEITARNGDAQAEPATITFK
ncbi:MAG: hypothetical protein RLZZ426_359 [Actinomycetota bacterium]